MVSLPLAIALVPRSSLNDDPNAVFDRKFDLEGERLVRSRTTVTSTSSAKSDATRETAVERPVTGNGLSDLLAVELVLAETVLDFPFVRDAVVGL